MGAEGNTGNANGITDVHHFYQGIIFLAQHILAHIQLHATGFILHIHKAGLAMATNSHYTTSHFYLCFCLSESFKLLLYIGAAMSPLKSAAEGTPAMLFDFMHFINAVLHLLVDFNLSKSLFFNLLLVFCHALSSFLFYFENFVGQLTCRSISYNNIMNLFAQNSGAHRGLVRNAIIKGVCFSSTNYGIGFFLASFNIL